MTGKAERRGFVLILSAPSGGGKSTLAQHLLEHLDKVCPSVSTTTRAPRGQERDGEAYCFVDSETFQNRIEEKAFLEWAEVFGNYYGTSRQVVEKNLAAGKDVLLDIDWQGARQVRLSLPKEDVVSVFIVPPSREELHQRLEGRGHDAPDVIERRMSKAGAEMSHWREYDYFLVNDDLPRAQENLIHIVLAERLRRERIGIKAKALLTSFGIESD
ncbi:MAG: guanylate kinase [Magnetococcales bacterium]|nr:guanylate kinase [Magnetococcales bacterium]